MILITFENQETLMFDDRFTAEVHVDTYTSAGIPVVKVRCDDTSIQLQFHNMWNCVTIISNKPKEV